MIDSIYEELPSPTVSQGLPITSFGFSDRDSASRFAFILGDAVAFISRVIDLERLDGITVAFDYGQALANLDRGYIPSVPLTYTQTNELVGVAMTLPVLRDGCVKSHMVFNALYILPLENPESENFNLALSLVAHECGHVAELKYYDQAFPGIIPQRHIHDQVDAILEQVQTSCWGEYVACRSSAIFGRDQTQIYAQNFTSVLSLARPRANDAIRAYRRHADIRRLLVEAGGPLWEPLRTASYLLGHLDGLNATIDEVPSARDQLAANPYNVFVTRLHDALRLLWSRRRVWESLAEFDSLKQIGRDVLAAGGLILHRLPDGRAYVDVPFTPETT